MKIDNLEKQLTNIARNINELLKEKNNIVVAIDGNCASGKTSLAKIISEVYDSNVIHMDDFFLPPELRTIERRNEIGGNIHYERFLDEVITPLQKHESIIYRKFDCHTMSYTKTIALQDRTLTIIEGSYSMREEFRFAYDYTIFVTCDYETQLNRILNRNGERCLQSFKSTWIPLENKYFKDMDIQNQCHIVINT